MPRHLTILLLLPLIAVSCSSGEDNDSTAGDTDAKRYTSADRSRVGPAIQDYEFGRTQGRVIELDGTRPDGGVFYIEGKRVHVFFPGAHIGNIEEDECAAQYDMVTEETSTAVDVTLYRVLPAEAPVGRGCDGAEDFVLVHTDLAEPLGDRTLTTRTHIVHPAFVDQRLEPTWVPDGWSEGEGRWDAIRGGDYRYGQVRVEIQALGDKFGVEIVRGNERHVNVSIRGVDDGAVVTRERSGEHRLGFEEAGWFYDFIAQPGVDRDQLIEFARGFELPGA